uniref:Insulin-like growth factor-binding protein 7 n=2 Tax=Caligus rogercresseyi TaxID=217165 RepID=C1BQR5_CALRO|nr:Insulin-like growth factor-binding protein 7 precursor [Caligus rogercresseyi]
MWNLNVSSLLLGVFLFSSCLSLILAAEEECEVCRNEECSPPTGCVAGQIGDRCGCCQICARSEEELCDLGARFKYGQCGENLDCVKRKDGARKEATCQCQVKDMVCGSDGLTYPTICSLNEETLRRGEPDKYNPQLTIANWGPCNEGPNIITPPKDITGPLGANLTLSCEVKGFPAPVITWKFVSVEEKTISLPSDNQGVSIQMRGGPEPLMVTGYAQIASLDPSYTGVYHCIASNSEGTAYAFAKVGVYKNEF